MTTKVEAGQTWRDEDGDDGDEYEVLAVREPRAWCIVHEDGYTFEAMTKHIIRDDTLVEPWQPQPGDVAMVGFSNDSDSELAYRIFVAMQGDSFGCLPMNEDGADTDIEQIAYYCNHPTTWSRCIPCEPTEVVAAAPAAPKYKAFALKWTTVPEIIGVGYRVDMGDLVEGYRIFGYGDDAEFDYDDTWSYHMPCDMDGNRKYAYGRLDK